jgi:hypothetical protein
MSGGVKIASIMGMARVVSFDIIMGMTSWVSVTSTAVIAGGVKKIDFYEHGQRALFSHSYGHSQWGKKGHYYEHDWVVYLAIIVGIPEGTHSYYYWHVQRVSVTITKSIARCSIHPLILTWPEWPIYLLLLA